MKHSLRFDRAIKALVKAFFEGTLAKENCVACVVGNIIASANGGKITTTLKYNHLNYECDIANHIWSNVFLGDEKDMREYVFKNKEFIDNTGYSVDELMEVESIFENTAKIDYIYYSDYTKEEVMQDQYNGLMGVVDVLCKFEGIEATETKELFNYKTK